MDAPQVVERAQARPVLATGRSFEVPVVYVMEFDHGLIKRLRSVFRDRRFQDAVRE
jgi:hypothetical protein